MLCRIVWYNFTAILEDAAAFIVRVHEKIFIIIVIIIIIIFSFMQGIHTHISETNHVPREYIAAAILSLFVVPQSLVPALALLSVFTLSLSKACVQCPIWLFSVVPLHHGFLVCCARIF